MATDSRHPGDSSSTPTKRPRKLTYEKLDPAQKNIRLLILRKADNRSDDIYCDLRRKSLAKKPRPLYHTVSYVWGDVTARSTIWLCGQRAEIGASAEQVLRRFRLKHRDRILWVDAVCIDQSNIEERGQQVAMMGEIYSGSSRNLIWLGEDDGTTIRALLAINVVVENARRESQDFTILREMLYESNPPWRYRHSESPLSVGYHEIDNVLTIFDKPWFTRLWVVQEAALPRSSTIHCGDHEIGLRTVLLAAAWLKYKLMYLLLRHGNHVGLANAQIMWTYTDPVNGRFAETHASRPRLREILHALQSSTAHDPRDHVYGFLGLYRKYWASKYLPKEILPDYTKSLNGVLQGAARFTILESAATEGSLDYIFTALSHRPGDLQRTDVPSWIPRYHRPYSFEYDAVGLIAPIGRETPCSPDMIQAIESSGLVLKLKGLAASRITAVEPTWTDAELHSPIAIRMRLQSFGRSFEHHDSGPALTLVAGVDHKHNPLLPWDAESALHSYLDFVMRGELPPSISSVELGLSAKYIREATTYGLAMYTACKNRRLFVTETGQPGLGPQVIEPGDIVVLFCGFGTPRVTVLRPLETVGHYRMCGEAYVYNLVDGYWATTQLAEGRKLETFYLH